MTVHPIGPCPQAALGTRGAVSSSHRAVSQVGAGVLASGGNAFDAMLAMAAMSWLTLPGQCGIGGDAFVLVREADGRTWASSGSGYGPDGGTPDFYRERGIDALPLSGPLSVAVPGAPAVLATMRERATCDLADLWAPALRAAEDGVPCTAKILSDVSEQATALAHDPGTAAVYLPGGELPRIGDLLRQPELGSTLRRLADDLGAFYTGWFADRAVTALVDSGAPFSGDEWLLTGSAPPEPSIETSYGGLRLHETPPPSAGWMVAHEARILDGVLRECEQLDADSVHWFAEAARAAFRHRFDHCGSDNDHWRSALEEPAVRRARHEIGRARVTTAVGVRDGDTTSMVCVDADGTAVSFIHSLALTFGARSTVPGTGVLLNDRLGRGSYLITGHPNEIRPRRKPLHTLNAWLLADDHDLVAAGNCPGGDAQVQWNMQVISHLVDHGDGPQRAVSLPRVSVHPGSDAHALGDAAELRCEEGIPEETLTRLEARGHPVVRLPEQHGGPGGSACVVSLDSGRGVLLAAADPRMDGVALAV